MLYYRQGKISLQIIFLGGMGMKTTRRLTAVALVLLLLLSLCGCMAEELPEEISRPETTRTTAATTLSTAPTTTATVTITDTTVVTTDATTQTATQTATTVVTTQVTTKVTVTATGSMATTTIPTSETSQSTHTQMTWPDYGVKTDSLGRPLYEPNKILVYIAEEHIKAEYEYVAADFPGIPITKIVTHYFKMTPIQFVIITLEGYGDEVINEAIFQAEQLPFVASATTVWIAYDTLEKFD